MTIDEQGDGWIPHTGLRVPEIPRLMCDILLRDGTEVEAANSYIWWPHWHWDSNSDSDDDIIAYRLLERDTWI